MRTDLAARIEDLRLHSQRQGTWGIEYGDDRFMADVLRLVRADLGVIAEKVAALKPDEARAALEAEPASDPWTEATDIEQAWRMGRSQGLNEALGQMSVVPERATVAANAILERPSADPDDDAAIVARALLRR